MNRLPLLAGAEPDAPIARYRGQTVSRREYLTHVARAAARLPERRHAVNLCGDRYHFMVTLGALLLRGQIALLPPNHAPRVIDEIAAEYDAYCVVDGPLEPVAAQQVEFDLDGSEPTPATLPEVSADDPAVVLFTSGSTGKPVPTAKSWGQLTGGTETALRRFGLDRAPAQLVATVPAQHSYGLESSVLYALFSACSVHAGRPFYPEDVRAALAEVPEPRVLVTTPVHLRACTEAGLEWPCTAFVLSATAPLSEALARSAEQTFGCPVREIYGCSEAGALASRRTVEGPAWRAYEGVRVALEADGAYVNSLYLPAAQRLADTLLVRPDGCFELLGRSADMLNIAGKRGSLQELTHRLLAIDGVVDGAFLRPSEADGGRLAAVVVAPGLERAELMRRLRHAVDPVFLPRPLVMVDVLPRNVTGKLLREDLLALLARRQPGRGDGQPG